MTFGPPLTAPEVALFETFVVPRYLSFFGSAAIEMLLPHTPARLAHIGCRTGYPDAIIADKITGCSFAGTDISPPALALARTKAELLSGVNAVYETCEGVPTQLPAEAFTHSLTLYPIASADERARLLAELHRVLMPGGQAVIALPLRGSFPEIHDMIREYALRHDMKALGEAVDAAAQSRPTIETIAEELESAGFTDVDVDVQLLAVSFPNGRDFLDDPVTKLFVLPDVRAALAIDEATMDASMKYAHEAIAKYWSECVFELTVNVGCASGRRVA